MFSLEQLWEAYQEADFDSQFGSYAAINPDDGRIVVVPSDVAIDTEEVEEIENYPKAIGSNYPREMNSI